MVPSGIPTTCRPSVCPGIHSKKSIWFVCKVLGPLAWLQSSISAVLGGDSNVCVLQFVVGHIDKFCQRQIWLDMLVKVLAKPTHTHTHPSSFQNDISYLPRTSYVAFGWVYLISSAICIYLHLPRCIQLRVSCRKCNLLCHGEMDI